MVACGSSPRVRGTRLYRGLQPIQLRFIPACAGNSHYGTVDGHTVPVHPRVCGELITAARARSARRGSSPRVRGTPFRQRHLAVEGRFIPACAGNSISRPSPASPESVHPRVCGELHYDVRHYWSTPGFIPACAGNSSASSINNGDLTVHPRVCGELDSLTLASHRSPRFIPACAGNSASSTARRRRGSGSSPRVRGTHQQPIVRFRLRRFIPACAGNSQRLRLRAHAPDRFIPACAGNSPKSAAYKLVVPGSSPRVRGTRDLCEINMKVARFIPACAGNSHAPPPRAPSRSVHPRVCGELELAGEEVRYVRRFIPACAGNSPYHFSRCSVTTVHPRVCGELTNGTTALYAADGSSPRVRGTQCMLDAAREALRFIPACAGNSLIA